jgi:hypothetical protein
MVSQHRPPGQHLGRGDEDTVRETIDSKLKERLAASDYQRYLREPQRQPLEHALTERELNGENVSTRGRGSRRDAVMAATGTHLSRFLTDWMDGTGLWRPFWTPSRTLTCDSGLRRHRLDSLH